MSKELLFTNDCYSRDLNLRLPYCSSEILKFCLCG